LPTIDRGRTFASLSSGARQAGFPNLKRLARMAIGHLYWLLARKEKNALTAPPPRLFKMVGKNVSAGVIPSWWAGDV